MSHPFNEDFRFGSASWAQDTDLRRAGLFGSRGPRIGHWRDNSLRLDGDAPILTVGGAGSGKTRDLLGYVLCDSSGLPMLVLDPRAELACISAHIHAAHGEHAWHWNPMGLCGLPRNRCNPLDILDRDSPTFHADVKFIVEGLIPLSGEGNGRYFELRAREWLENLIKSRIERHGKMTLPDLYRLINVVESDRRAWADHLEAMLASSSESIRRTAAEMLTKQQDTPKEFGAIMGEIYAHLSFLDDPALLASLENPEFSLKALTDTRRTAKVFLNIPAEYLSIWSPLVRLFFTVTMLYKARAPEAPRIMLLVDEAGQLGRFEALLRAFTYGRGFGVRAWAIFQDIGQIVRNFGAPALQSFMGSAQTRQFFGVRDYETARLVSDMLGTETLEYDDVLQQEAARRQKRETVERVMRGDDPFAAAHDYAHFRRNAEHRTKQARPLMTPDEILAMPEDRQILFISGKDLKPVYANKYPYFTRREMAGHYLPNPYHPPVGSVVVATRLGKKRIPVVTERVPGKYASFPQYASGYWSYVKGYRPD
ncbi:MAG: hypothetical protein CMM50_06820 [Rhodospirillaceae bacterium]|nr:hypothetical protein [Rhodospirillaceae bacterium]